ncbi:MAG: ABC transporter substrate-binding protein [Actinomycetota bacterium]
MRRAKWLVLTACLAVAIGVAALTAASVSASGSAKSVTGGTYVVGWESSFGWTDGFDPTGEYLANGFAIYGSLLLRTLVGFNHVAGAAGNLPVPDLAQAVPKPTNGGKTYTFKLKQGIKFGPPVNREITSADIRYAVERMARPKNGAQYGFYYTVIQGWDAYSKGKGKSISGIKTPNSKTIVFNLTAPTGDFPFRMSMPATAPIPPEVGKCFEGKPGKYGLDVIASGPYMIEGSDSIDVGSCGAIKPMSGISETELTLVRNPTYNASTDSKKSRENKPDRFEFVVNTNVDDIYNKIASGDYEDAYASPTAKVIREYSTSASKRKQLKVNSADQVNYLTMNLTQPPFDDVHVRRAMNWVMDRAGLRSAWGGAVAGPVANHILPDAMLNGVLKNFAPFKTPGDHGSVSKAKAEMAKSKYSTKSGVCSASECKDVLLIADVRAVDKAMLPVIQSSSAKIGITFKVRSVNGAYPVIQTVANNTPISERPRWGKDYADPVTFLEPLFYGKNIIASGNTNYSLVGLTAAQAKEFKVTGSTSNVPSIDKGIQACAAKTGRARIVCYAGLDRQLTTEVVPWIPYLWRDQLNVLGPDVATWSFDQAAGLAGFGHVSLKQS